MSAIFSVPTAFRVIRRVDPEIKFGRKYSTKSLRTIFIAGEHCDLETKMWMEKVFKVPVLNHWWQTETGSAITGIFNVIVAIDNVYILLICFHSHLSRIQSEITSTESNDRIALPWI